MNPEQARELLAAIALQLGIRLPAEQAEVREQRYGGHLAG